MPVAARRSIHWRLRVGRDDVFFDLQTVAQADVVEDGLNHWMSPVAARGGHGPWTGRVPPPRRARVRGRSASAISSEVADAAHVVGADLALLDDGRDGRLDAAAQFGSPSQSSIILAVRIVAIGLTL